MKPNASSCERKADCELQNQSVDVRFIKPKTQRDREREGERERVTARPAALRSSLMKILSCINAGGLQALFTTTSSAATDD